VKNEVKKKIKTNKLREEQVIRTKNRLKKDIFHREKIRRRKGEIEILII